MHFGVVCTAALLGTGDKCARERFAAISSRAYVLYYKGAKSAREGKERMTIHPAAKEKKALYERLEAQLRALMEGERTPLPNLANASALLYDALPDLNWAGFYLNVGQELLLGPFQGKPACIRIPFERGVCGKAAREQKSQVVADVHAFPGHIACDGASQSEVVVPLVKEGRLLGVMDLDSPLLSRFEDEDRAGLERLAEALCQGCDFP